MADETTVATKFEDHLPPVPDYLHSRYAPCDEGKSRWHTWGTGIAWHPRKTTCPDCLVNEVAYVLQWSVADGSSTPW